MSKGKQTRSTSNNQAKPEGRNSEREKHDNGENRPSNRLLPHTPTLKLAEVNFDRRPSFSVLITSKHSNVRKKKNSAKLTRLIMTCTRATEELPIREILRSSYRRATSHHFAANRDLA